MPSAAAETHEPATPCVGCRTPLPPHAMFCVECGLCLLDVTESGTVIATHPSEESDRIHVGVELDLDAVFERLLAHDDDEDRDEQEDIVDEDELTRTFALQTSDDSVRSAGEIDRPDPTLVTHGPVEPAPFWEAPPPGDTIVAPVPAS